MTAGHIQHQAEARGHAFKKPNVRGRHGKIDVAHPLTAHTGEGDLHAATIANDAFVFNALIFAAGTFPILDGAKDAFAKEAAFLGLEGAVVDGLGVFDLALGPAADGFGAGDGQGDVIHEVHAFEPQQLTGGLIGSVAHIFFQISFCLG